MKWGVFMKKNNYHINEETFQAASSQDCTGLIPALPANEKEMEYYEELYDFLPPGGKNIIERNKEH